MKDHVPASQTVYKNDCYSIVKCIAMPIMYTFYAQLYFL